MSDSYLKIISTNPDYSPSLANQNSMKLLLSKHYPSGKIEVVITDSVEFIDQGGNFESVKCNFCQRELETTKWQEFMDKAYEKHFNDLTFITPCCHKMSSLNDLHYEMPAGFAKFSILINGASEDPTQEELSRLEKIMETKLRLIWAHY